MDSYKAMFVLGLDLKFLTNILVWMKWASEKGDAEQPWNEKKDNDGLNEVDVSIISYPIAVFCLGSYACFSP